jgi:predicted metal-dependent hydrolase
MKHFITLDNNVVLEYDFTPKPIKNIYVKISKDGKVVVSAPKTMPLCRVEDFIVKKQAFILKSISTKKEDVDLLNLKNVCFFGHTYTVIYVKSNKNLAYISGDNFVIQGALDKDCITKSLNNFLLVSAKQIYPNIVKECFDNFGYVKIPYPKLKYRIMTTRWGTCNTKNGDITLNPNLIKYPLSCLKYVIYHELSHLVVPNHSKYFYNVLKKVYPDYKNQKLLLKNYKTSF